MGGKKYIIFGSGLVVAGVAGLVMMTIVAYQQMSFSSSSKTVSDEAMVVDTPSQKVAAAMLGVDGNGAIKLRPPVGKKVTAVQATMSFPFTGDVKTLKAVSGIANMDYTVKEVKLDKQTGRAMVTFLATNISGVIFDTEQVVGKVSSTSGLSSQTNFTLNREVCKVFVAGETLPILLEYN